MELKLYRLVLFQGNGSDNRKDCFEQHKKTAESLLDSFFFAQDLLAPLREPNGAGSGAYVVYKVKALLGDRENDVWA